MIDRPAGVAEVWEEFAATDVGEEEVEEAGVLPAVRQRDQERVLDHLVEVSESGWLTLKFVWQQEQYWVPDNLVKMSVSSRMGGRIV